MQQCFQLSFIYSGVNYYRLKSCKNGYYFAAPTDPISDINSHVTLSKFAYIRKKKSVNFVFGF